jgi:hypothetical protein
MKTLTATFVTNVIPGSKGSDYEKSKKRFDNRGRYGYSHIPAGFGECAGQIQWRGHC